jgi:SanA protein
MIIFFLALGIVLFGLPRLVTAVYALSRVHSVTEASPARVAIVFGAGLKRDGTPTAVLRDRVMTAVELYHAGKVEKLLMSGDNRFEDYNEPEAMYKFALELGVPEEDIVRDYAGRRTYDTCYRARDIFGLNEVLLVTQGFHLPRAVFLCNALGVKGHGVEADQRTYRRSSYLFWGMRETVATFAAFVDVYVTKPEPVLGESEPIFPDG